MTTELTNITTVRARLSLKSQLPTVANHSETVSQPKPDNIVRIDNVKRQEFANIDKVTNKQNQSLEGTKSQKSDVRETVQELNVTPQLVSRNLEFRVDSESGKTVITVRDTQTQEIIRQIPSEQLLEISGRLKQLMETKLDDNSATGIFFTSQT